MTPGRVVALAGVVSLALVACTSAPAVRTFGVQQPMAVENHNAAKPVTLEGMDWRVLRLGAVAVLEADKMLVMRLEKGRVAGYGGCNHYNGGYKYDNVHFVFTSVVASMKACAATASQEQALFQALQKTRYWHIDRQTEHLQFLDNNQQLLLEYEQGRKQP